MLVRARGAVQSVVVRGDWTAIALSQLLAATLLLRLLWLDQPPGDLIFDEVYYVNAARTILGWPVPAGDPYAGAPPGVDPNTEHLPLAKLIIAGSMHLLGDNALGWRLPSVLLGTAAVGLLYLLVRKVAGRADVALLAAFVFSFDNLVFVHGRIATLDIYALFFMLLGLYLYSASRPAPAGAALALGMLAKLNGVFGLGAILAFEAMRLLRRDARGTLRATAGSLLILSGTFVVVAVVGLWAMDRLWTPYDNPLAHLAYVYNYGTSMTREEFPSSIESLPWQWLVNQVPIPYLKIEHNLTVDGSVVSSQPVVDFQGAMNPFVIGLLPLVVGYLLERAVRGRQDFPMLLLAVLAATYLPLLLVAVLAHRVSYIFYFLPALPVLSAGIAYLLVDSHLPRILTLYYVASVLLGFAVMFPFRFV